MKSKFLLIVTMLMSTLSSCEEKENKTKVTQALKQFNQRKEELNY